MFLPKDRSFLTFKAGKWIFSAACDETEVEPWLIRAETLLEALFSTPMLPEWVGRFQEELVRKSIFGTAAMEGNPLTEAEVGRWLSADSAQTSSHAHREIENLKELYQTLSDPGRAQAPLDEAQIRQFHACICRGLAFEDNIPGQYRVGRVVVGDEAHGGIYTPPRERADVMHLMRELFAWLDGEDVQRLSPLLRAACVHYYLVLIHPFRDGNGRTARFAEAYLLAGAGMKLLAPALSNYYYRHKDDYFSALSRSGKKRDLTAFFTFMLQGVCEAVREIQKEIHDVMKMQLLLNYTVDLRRENRISERQKNLFDMVSTYVHTFSVESIRNDPSLAALYKGVSTMTARRDIKRLEELGLLARNGKTYSIRDDWLTQH
ncbi:Fic family protein [uncultured Mailhella sp.]|uniref:Fic family protein n=1 Tax=uncultured Mailhella sp. TaxID=1981031 RepID=UPI002612F8B6|nr:Fic family protein [uncultured Mailhella sp.]